MKKELSRRQARKRLIRKEQLQEGKKRTYEAALRWYEAHQAVGMPGLGDGAPALGEIIQNVSTQPNGQKNIVRWHNGTMTVCWFSSAAHPVGTWIVATTHWQNMSEGVWLTERAMNVDELVDVMTAETRSEHDSYWNYSRELDDLELMNHLMIAPTATHDDVPATNAHLENTDGVEKQRTTTRRLRVILNRRLATSVVSD